VVGIAGGVQSNPLAGDRAGVCGVAADTTGVRGKSGSYFGVQGESQSSAGVHGEGYSGVSGFGFGVGVSGRSDIGYGVLATSNTGVGMRGFSNGTSLTTSAVVGQNNDPAGTGVFGWGTGQSSNGVVGFAGLRGVWGVCGNGNGVQGQSSNGSGVFGVSTGGPGVRGESSTGPGVYGRSTSWMAGVFEGNVLVTGTLFKGNLAFKIDHPLDPKNKYLNHSGVESSDMKNIYDGIAELDAKGQAVVKLPAWFEALNNDFRYQLTPLGESASDLHIAKEIEGNRFVIGGGKPRIRVCWQVTGIRQDAFANANRLPVEENKPANERGLFLHPEPFKQSEKKRIPLGGEPEALDKAEKDFAQISKELAKQPKSPELPEPKSQHKPKKGSR